MPTFIPASGPTLHLAGVCVNRIGKEPSLAASLREHENRPSNGITANTGLECDSVHSASVSKSRE